MQDSLKFRKCRKTIWGPFEKRGLYFYLSTPPTFCFAFPHYQKSCVVIFLNYASL